MSAKPAKPDPRKFIWTPADVKITRPATVAAEKITLGSNPTGKR